MWDKIKRTKIVSWYLRKINRNYSTCEICGLPWNHCQEKTVNYDNYSGTFATCKYCWDHSDITEIRFAYIKVYNNQRSELFKCGEFIDNTLEHLLTCVETEYYKDIRKLREHKLKKIINRICSIHLK